MKIAPIIGFLLFIIVHSNAQVFEYNQIEMCWKDSHGKPYQTFDNILKEHPNAKFIMNAGMYNDKYQPVGLFIENGKIITPVKIVKNSKVNFGIQPQGIFCITSSGAHIYTVPNSQAIKEMVYATQSAPMLVIDGKINPNLPTGYNFIRNGVGIRPDGKVLFACKEMNFKEFAKYFLDNGCSTALYLDGVISEIWERGKTSYGKFGPMIVCY